MQFIVYDMRDGRIVRAGSCLPATFAAQASGEHESMLPLGEDLGQVYTIQDEYHVVAGEFVERPIIYPHSTATIAGDGLDELVIGNVPAGTKVYLDGHPIGTIDDGELVYTSIEPRKHFLRLHPPMPWRDQTITVTVT